MTGSPEKEYAPVVARQALVEHFAALQWKIARETNDCLGVALHDRPSQTWDEGFMVCLNDGLYLLVHVGLDQESVVRNAVGDALFDIAGRICLGEL